jgi:ketosteroid isomerase-like protein
MTLLGAPLLVSLALGSGAVSVGAQGSGTDSIVDMLMAREHLIARAVSEGDLAALDTVYAENFRLTLSSGLALTKCEWLESIERAGTSGVVTTRTVDRQEGESFGDLAILTGRIRMRTEVDRSEEVSRVTYVRVYQKRQDRWVMLWHRTLEQFGGGSPIQDRPAVRS